MLTARQRDALGVIERHLAAHRGVGPTMQEIADGIGLKSKSGALRLMVSLEERGFIRRLPGRARGIALVKPAGTPGRAEHDLTPELLAMLQGVMWSASTDLAEGGVAPGCAWCGAERPAELNALCGCALGRLVARGRAACLQGPQEDRT